MSICRSCGDKLDLKTNWFESSMRDNSNICKKCVTDRSTKWRANNYEQYIETTRKRHGAMPMNANKTCSSYLGCHVAEGVLSSVFKDVKVMPFGNPGYDFICNHGKKIDVKSGCTLKPGGNRSDLWNFHIGRNKIPDYFLCIAFDNRNDLNPLHLWLIPGDVVSHLSGTSISKTSLHKWDKYKLAVNDVVEACFQKRDGV